MTDTKNYFKENLNRLIREKGATQKEIADFIGVSTPTMNYYVKGINVPRMDKLDKLCTFFGCTRSDLLEPPKKHDITDNYAEYVRMLKELDFTVIELVNLGSTKINGIAVDYDYKGERFLGYTFNTKEDFCQCIHTALEEYKDITNTILQQTIRSALNKRLAEDLKEDIGHDE
jgi:transcriptional regulator with XRE-family HTH domain